MMEFQIVAKAKTIFIRKNNPMVKSPLSANGVK